VYDISQRHQLCSSQLAAASPNLLLLLLLWCKVTNNVLPPATCHRTTCRALDSASPAELNMLLARHLHMLAYDHCLCPCCCQLHLPLLLLLLAVRYC
jgi:hypothetical protein